MDSLSIVIPTFNNSRYLNLCLKALKENSQLENEILIHIDGSTDNTREIISKYTNDLNITVTESEQKGLYSAINSAMRNATKDRFVLINDDIVAGPKWDINFISFAKPNRVICPWMVEKYKGSYTQNKVFGGHTPEEFNLLQFNNYVVSTLKKNLNELGFILNCTVGMWSTLTDLFKRFNGCDEAFNPFGRGGKELLYRIRIVYPEFEFGAITKSLVYHFSAACKRENKRDHLVNLQTWNDKYPEIKSQEANDLLEGKRGYFDIEKTKEFKERCLFGHLGKGLI